MRSRTEAPCVHCPDCGCIYPPGIVISPDGALLGLVAESGGLRRESECPGNSQAESVGATWLLLADTL